jgi:hypothetical protein
VLKYTHGFVYWNKAKAVLLCRRKWAGYKGKCFCEKSERDSHKHKDKWGKANRKRRLDYIGLIFAKNIFKNKLRFSIYRGQVNYDMTTIVGIAKAVHYKEPKKYSTVIYVDGLRKSKRKEYGSELRKLGVHTRKVQGVNKDENNALIRLADSMAGFVRDAIGGKDRESSKLFKSALKSESLVEV